WSAIAARRTSRTLVISVDGKPAKTVRVPVQISLVNQQGGATHRVNEEARVFVPASECTFRAQFVDDEGIASEVYTTRCAELPTHPRPCPRLRRATESSLADHWARRRRLDVPSHGQPA